MVYIVIIKHVCENTFHEIDFWLLLLLLFSSGLRYVQATKIGKVVRRIAGMSIANEPANVIVRSQALYQRWKQQLIDPAMGGTEPKAESPPAPAADQSIAQPEENRSSPKSTADEQGTESTTVDTESKAEESAKERCDSAEVVKSETVVDAQFAEFVHV